MTKSFLIFTSYLIAVFCYLLFINISLLDGIPHVPDDAAYLFMAKSLTSGKIITDIPVPPAFVDFFPGILTVERGTWLFQYPLGHPLLLSVGVLLGFPNAIPPLIGVGNILLLFLIARTLYQSVEKYFVIILPIISPFFLENAASFMSHNTAALYALSAFYFLIRHTKDPTRPLFIILTGSFLGLLLNTRPLTALPFIAIASLVLIICHKKLALRPLLLLGGSLGIFITLWGIYNLITTGNALHSQYYVMNQGLFGVGQPTEALTAFLTERFFNLRILFHNLIPMLFNLPFVFTFGFILIPFLLRRAVFWDYIFMLILFSLPFCYFFYNGTFLMYGPRFWYEITPFFFLLTARGLAIMYLLRPRMLLLVFLMLIAISQGRWFGFLPTTDPDYFSPRQLSRLKGFNFTDDRIIEKLRKENIQNAVVFVADCGGHWWCYGSVFPQNKPDLSSDIVYLKDLGTENTSVMRSFPTRSFYRIDYDTLALEQLSQR
jgi:hypothetical protein